MALSSPPQATGSKSGNWKDVLKSQNNDLQRLQAKDAALSADHNTQNIMNFDPANLVPVTPETKHHRVLSSSSANSSISSHSAAAARSKRLALHNSGGESSAPSPPFGKRGSQFAMDDIYDNKSDESLLMNSSRDNIQNSNTKGQAPSHGMEELNSSPHHGETAGIAATETAERFVKAKLKLLTKQLEDGVELRLKMEEQNKDLQRQLKTEREENKRLNKRIQIMETDLRKTGNVKGGRGAEGNQNGGPLDKESADAFAQEIALLKKDLETAERMGKQSEANTKNKDLQLKRAAETIAKLKTQLQESQLNLQTGVSGEKSKCEALETRIKVLEKQRAELIDGFRKQMKLIDILKRQKVHIEAARLLSFTEEEFMKTLDWKV
mmetsp:Transcript_20828/g.29841  ORF Transcript_20828/g.29841 Transcript_20828/m.29841 type:complete len:381 (+) Transcript_20828:73-1215(+)